MKSNSIKIPRRWKVLRRGGILLVCFFGILALLDHWLPYALLSHHNRSVDLQLRPRGEQIKITAADGTVTQGWLLPAPTTPLEVLPRGNAREGDDVTQAAIKAALATAPPPTTLILLHGLGANRQDYLDFALALQEGAVAQGIPLSIAAMDLRGHGESQGTYFTYGYHEAQDITALIDELEVQHRRSLPVGMPSQYAILGISVGGAVATIATAQDDRIAALITIGTFADLAATAETQTELLPDFWRDRVLRRAEAIAQFDIAKAAPTHSMAQVQVPVLIAHGEIDGYIPFTNAEQLYAVAKEPKWLYSILDADHADMISTGGETLQREILQFLQGAIAPQASAGIAP